MALSSFSSGMLGGATVGIVIKAIDDYSKEFNNLQKELKSTESSFSSFGKIAGKIAAPALAAVATSMAAFAVSSLQAAAQMEPIKRGFQDLAVNSDDLLLKLNNATVGTVNNFELMSAANKALLLGLDQNALPSLFKNAAIVAQAAGRTTTEAVTDITLGIGRQSKLILDNLGILVNAETAYENYAVSIGKTTTQLTEQEKQTAFTNAAIAALDKRAQELGGTLEETLSVQLAQLQTEWDNLKVQMGEELAPEFKKFLDVLTENKEGITGLIEASTSLAGYLIGEFSQALDYAGKKGEEFGRGMYYMMALLKGDATFAELAEAERIHNLPPSPLPKTTGGGVGGVKTPTTTTFSPGGSSGYIPGYHTSFDDRTPKPAKITVVIDGANHTKTNNVAKAKT